MKNLSRRLEKLEAAIPAPDNWSVKRKELISRLTFDERGKLREALGQLRAGAATQEDLETIRSIITLAQERFDAGMIIVRERKPPAQSNAEMREALRQQRETGQHWRLIGNYNEFLVEEL